MDEVSSPVFGVIRQSLRVLRFAACIVLFLILYSDYLSWVIQHPTSTVVTYDDTPQVVTQPLPQSSFTGHKDGDMLTGPATAASNF